MSTVNRNQLQTADQNMIGGLSKHKATIPSLPIGGKTLTPDEAIQVLQTRIDASNRSLSARASAKAAVLAERSERSQTRQFVSSLRQVVRSMFEGSADVLADFGLALRKPRKVDPQKKVTAAGKAKATRVLRHTMGKKQKAGIKATAPIPTGGPAPAVNAPAAPAAPANPPPATTAPAAPSVATPPAAPAPAAPSTGTAATHS
jgi:hypothetical protein